MSKPPDAKSPFDRMRDAQMILLEIRPTLNPHDTELMNAALSILCDIAQRFDDPRNA